MHYLLIWFNGEVPTSCCGPYQAKDDEEALQLARQFSKRIDKAYRVYRIIDCGMCVFIGTSL